MPGKQDYYGTLGVGKDAPLDEIRKAYRKLARKYHPDLNPGDKAAEERFKNVQEAYDVLGDTKKRQMYDQYGFYSPNGYPGTGPGAGGRAEPNMDFGGFDFSDFFSQQTGGAKRPAAGGGGFRDIFSQFFGGREAEEENEPEKGSDLEYGLNIDFWQALKGTTVPLQITRHEVCSTCKGSGSAGGGTVNCPQCNGTGQVTQMA